MEAPPTMGEICAKFADLFGREMDVIPDLVSVESADIRRTQGETQAGNQSGVTDDDDSLVVYESSVVMRRRLLKKLQKVQTETRTRAQTDASVRLEYMATLWPDLTCDPVFANTPEYLARVEQRQSRWLKEQETRQSETGTVDEPKLFKPHNTYRLDDQSATHLIVSRIPDTSHLSLSESTQAMNDALLYSTEARLAVLEDVLRAMEPARRAAYIQGLEDELTKMSETHRLVASGSGADRVQDLKTQLYVFAQLNIPNEEQDADSPPGGEKTPESPGGAPKPYVTPEELATPLPDKCMTKMSIRGIRAQLADPKPKVLSKKYLPKEFRKLPIVKSGRRDPVANPQGDTLVFSIPYVEDAHLAPTQAVHAQPEDTAALADSLFRITEGRFRAEAEYVHRGDYQVARGTLLHAAFNARRSDKAVAGLPAYEPTTGATWTDAPLPVPITPRNSLVRIDEPVHSRVDGTPGVRLYVAQNGEIACYSLDELRSVQGARVTPLWVATGLPPLVALEVSEGWIAATTMGGMILVLRVPADGAVCHATMFRAPLHTTIAWQTASSTMDERAHELWFGELTGNMSQLRVALRDDSPGVEIGRTHCMWTQHVNPVYKIVARGQHVLALNDFAVVSRPVPHAFGGGLPRHNMLLHAITDLSFSGTVAVAQRVDGTVYLLDLIRGKLDTTIDRIPKLLKAMNREETIFTSSRLVYFNGDYLRAIVPSFVYLQSTICPATPAT